MRSYSIALPPTCQFCHSSLSLTSSLHPTHICYVWFARPKSVRGETQAANVLKGYPCLLTQLACCFATFSLPRLKLLLSTHFEGHFTFVRSCKHGAFKFLNFYIWVMGVLSLRWVRASWHCRPEMEALIKSKISLHDTEAKLFPYMRHVADVKTMWFIWWPVLLLYKKNMHMDAT